MTEFPQINLSVDKSCKANYARKAVTMRLKFELKQTEIKEIFIVAEIREEQSIRYRLSKQNKPQQLF